MDCNRIVDATFLCLDNEMDQPMRTAYEDHLRRCPACKSRSEVVVACLLLIRRSPACRCRAPRSLELRIRRRLKERALRARPDAASPR